MAVAFSGLMCHAPIVHPQVGGERARDCVTTTRAMREVAARAVAGRPDRLVVISPHSPRHATSFAAWTGRHRGDLGDFRAPQVAVDLADAPEVGRSLELPPVRDRPGWLDHGAMVPLSFLWEAGWRGPTAILALPWERGRDCEGLGRRLAALPGSTSVIASGDMSHRLQPGAPAGFHPDAKRFDEAFVQALRNRDWEGLQHTPYREEAAEDVVDTTRVALGAAGEPLHAEVLAYEGPWGVGYTEAVFRDPSPPLYALARQAVVQAVTGEGWSPASGGPEGKAVFVTLRKDGALRGCIGRLAPGTNDLWLEVADQARAAALRDPRFPRVGASELSALHYEVSVLETPEPVDGPHQLDPARFGVVVTDGRRRGVLLPEIEGIDTVTEQIHHARRKAGIPPDQAVQLLRFEVRKAVQP